MLLVATGCEGYSSSGRSTDTGADDSGNGTDYIQGSMGDDAKVLLLHHSTGARIMMGGVPVWFLDYNTQNDKNYDFDDLEFPKASPYGWNNNPYDYWNVWVNHAGS